MKLLPHLSNVYDAYAYLCRGHDQVFMVLRLNKITGMAEVFRPRKEPLLSLFDTYVYVAYVSNPIYAGDMTYSLQEGRGNTFSMCRYNMKDIYVHQYSVIYGQFFMF